MNRDTIFSDCNITFEQREESTHYQAVQMLQLFLRAKQENRPLVLPSDCDEAELDSFARFLSEHKEAFHHTKKGLPKEFYCGDSLFSEDEKNLYLFIFTSAEAQIMVKGIIKNKKTVTYLSSGKSVQLDETAEPWNGANTLWLKLTPAEIHPICTVVCISYVEPIKLYYGTGVHLLP